VAKRTKQLCNNSLILQLQQVVFVAKRDDGNRAKWGIPKW